MPLILINRVTDPVSPLYSGFDFEVAGHWVTSIEMAVWVLVFHLHSRFDLIPALINKTGLRINAIGITSWVKSRNFIISPKCLFHLAFIYYKVITQLLRITNSTIIARFLDVAFLHGDEVEYVLTSHPHRREFVWSCGLHPTSNKFDRFEDYGFNVYGKILTRAYHEWRSGKHFEALTISSILTSNADTDDNICHTVLVLSDSQCKQLSSIYNGKVIAISGAKYSTLARAIWDQYIDVRKYSYILIHCGINLCRTYDPDFWYESWRELEMALKPAIKSGNQKIIVNPHLDPKITSREGTCSFHAKTNEKHS